MTSHRRAGVFQPRWAFGPTGPVGYDGEVVADSPLAYYGAGELSGTVAHDLTSNGHDGSYAGTYTLNQPSLLVSDAATSVAVNGGYIQASSASWHNDTGTTDTAFTWECWVEFDSVGGNQAIMGKWENGSAGQAGLVWLNLSNQIEAAWIIGGNMTRAAWTTVPSTGTPYHIVATYDGTALRLYANGTKVAETSVTGLAEMSPGTHFNFGSYNNASYPIHGYLQKCAMYGHALTDARVAAHYAAAA